MSFIPIPLSPKKSTFPDALLKKIKKRSNCLPLCYYLLVFGFNQQAPLIPLLLLFKNSPLNGNAKDQGCATATCKKGKSSC
jgi:hypothetical protein